MTLLRWQDHYDAGAEAYDTPEVVKSYYTTDYEEPSWGDASLAATFGERLALRKTSDHRLTFHCRVHW